MAKKCDNKSVAVVVRRGQDILMIERKKYNFGFALPAGHQDGDDPETTAKKELFEEVGLIANAIVKKLNTRLPNPCKRDGGVYHDWTVFEATKWSGDVKLSADETKSYIWTDKAMVAQIIKRLEDFLLSAHILLTAENLPEIVKKTNEDEEWKESPGLEPPMYFLFKELKLI